MCCQGVSHYIRIIGLCSYVIFILLWSFWEMGPRPYFHITVVRIGDDEIRNYRLCNVRDSDHCEAKWSKVLDDKILREKLCSDVIPD